MKLPLLHKNLLAVFVLVYVTVVMWFSGMVQIMVTPGNSFIRPISNKSLLGNSVPAIPLVATS